MSCPTLSIRKHPTTGDELGFPRSNRGREQRNRDSRLSSNLRHSRQRRRHELCSLLGWLDHHGFPPPTALSENGQIPKGRLAAIDAAALEIDGGTSREEQLSWRLVSQPLSHMAPDAPSASRPPRSTRPCSRPSGRSSSGPHPVCPTNNPGTRVALGSL